MMTTGMDHMIRLIDKEVFIYRKPYIVLEAYNVVNIDGYLCITTTGEAIYLNSFQVDKLLEKE